MSLFYRVEDGVATIEFNHPDAKVNILTGDVLRQFNIFVTQAENDPLVKVLVIRSGKKDVFIAGADIKEIEGITKPEDGETKARFGQDIFNHLEDLNMPTVAVIDGVTLGGGCELALACRYRIATVNEKIKIGLPEVNLGILPGFGGTYRLPRVIGISQALGIILGARTVSVNDALKLGLVDRLIPQENLEEGLKNFINEIKDSPARKKQFLRRPKGFQRFMDDSFIGHVLAFEMAGKNVRAQAKGFYPAPLKALDVMRETFGTTREKVLAAEAKGFGQLVVGDVCKNLIKVFYLTERYKKLMPPECADLKPRNIRHCGVLGAGVMGGGIAQILSYNNIAARMKDVNYDALAKGLQAASKVFNQLVQKRKLKPPLAVGKMLQITTSVDYSGFGNVDCVIEAVVEKMEIKKKVFSEVSQAVAPGTLMFTNTSALSVTEMAKSVSDPTRMLGFHFFNPVHRMPLVELVWTKDTSAQTMADALGLVRRLGKTPIIVKDSPGFLVNRILLAYINEAGYILQEGGGISMIDRLMKDFGMPMGPLTLSDEVGLDVGVKVLHILHEGLGDRFKPAEIFETISQKGFLGKKSGTGFYLHNTKNKMTNPEIEKLRKLRIFTKDEERVAKDRMILVMINEAARCLQDKIIDEPDTVDVGMILGTGFPPFRAGLLHYADQLGIENVVDSLHMLAEKLEAKRFEPCAYLLDMSHKKGKFYMSVPKPMGTRS